MRLLKVAPPGKRQKHLSVILLLFVALTLYHYRELVQPALNGLTIPSGLSRHAFDRFVYLGLVVYAGASLGIKAGVIACLAAAAAMLPRAFLLSPSPRDAVGESLIALVVAGMAMALIRTWQDAKRQQEELKQAVAQLRSSQQSFRELFENASDAIWVHDLRGKITMANRASEKIIGYPPSQLVGRNVAEFLSSEALALARGVKDKLMLGENMDQRYEQRILRKDGKEAIVELTTRLITVDGRPEGFQNIARDVTEARMLRDNLRFQIRKSIMAQEEERKRIARELHDDIAQSLLVLSHRLDMLISQSGKKPSAVVSELEQLHGIATETHRNLQRYSRDLRPRILDEMGLVPALNWLADELTKDMRITTEVKAGKMPPLHSQTELIMFRIAQEALNNIRKHAGASRVAITLETLPGRLRMTIADNGKGFSLSQLTGNLAREGKLGLLGMEERAGLIGGNLDIESVAGKGTTIVLSVPYEALVG